MLPYPGIPYGAAPGWCFPLCEGCMLLLLAACVVHAARRGRQALAYVLGGLVFGLSLEYMEVLSGSYTYGRFTLMLGVAPRMIPFCIGAGWAIILYTSRLFSDALGLRGWSAAALDTLLALNIDLSMDVVAYRLHMWHWSWTGTHLDPLRAQWFGIPYGNFVGWATVVFCYSAFSRLLERTLLRARAGSTQRAAATALLAVVFSFAVLFGTETFVYPLLRDHFGVSSRTRLIVILAGMLGLLVQGWRGRQAAARPMPGLAVWVPSWFHLFFVACFFGFGFYRESAAMTAVACVNVLAGVLLHLYPWWERRRMPGARQPALLDGVGV